MRILSSVVFLVLSMIAALHVYWGLGGLWPGSDVRSLIDTVVGDPRLEVMPPTGLTLVVAGLIFASGVFAQLAARRSRGLFGYFVSAAIVVITLVFLARGASGYLLPHSIRTQMSEPFATYDRLFYAPLCLILGVAFAVLLYNRVRRGSGSA